MSAATVPNPSDADVMELIEINGLTGVPQYVRYEDHGYDSQWCHISAKHRTLTKGGRRVHGWALWRWPVPDAPEGTTIILAEHHSIWQSPDNELIDVTPPRFGVPSVLFVRDDAARIEFDGAAFQMKTDLTSWLEVPRMLRGQPTNELHYPLIPAIRPDVVDYANHLNFELDQLSTGDEHG